MSNRITMPPTESKPKKTRTKGKPAPVYVLKSLDPATEEIFADTANAKKWIAAHADGKTRFLAASIHYDGTPKIVERKPKVTL